MVAQKTAEAAKSTIKTDVAGRRTKTAGEPKLAAYAEKAVPTRIQEFAEWITAETGYEVDLRSVYLGSSLRGSFQKSDGNQANIAKRAEELVAEREARAQAKIDREAAKVANAAARAEKAKAAAEAKAAAAAEAKANPAPKAAPVKKTPATKAPAKAAPAKATPRRRPAKPVAATTEETATDF